MSVSINLYRARIGMWSLHDSRRKTPHVKSQTEHNGAFCINIILILLLLLSGDVHPNPGPNRPKKSNDIYHINAEESEDL